jgi:hypothetical protein
MDEDVDYEDDPKQFKAHMKERKEKDFNKMLNKKDLNKFELDELFLEEE